MKEEKIKKINVDCVCFDKGNGWFFNNECGIFCKFDIATKEINTQYKSPAGAGWVSVQMSICGDKIFLYPYACSKLLIFNIAKEFFEEIDIINSPGENLFVQYIGIFKDCMYVYLINDAAVIEINTNTLECREIIVLPKEFLHKVASDEVKCINGSILFPVIDRNVLLEFEIESRKLKEHIVRGFSGGVYTVVYDGNFYWITGRDKTYIKWDKRTGKIVEKWDLPGTLEVYCTEQNKWIKYQRPSTVSTFPFLHSILVGDKIWLFPYMANMILQIDVHSGQYKELFCPDKDKKYVPNMKPCELLGVDDRNNIVFSTPEKCYCVLDIKALNRDEYYFKADIEFLAGNIIYETDSIDLSRFIRAVCIQKTTRLQKKEKQ